MIFLIATFEPGLSTYGAGAAELMTSIRHLTSSGIERTPSRLAIPEIAEVKSLLTGDLRGLSRAYGRRMVGLA